MDASEGRLETVRGGRSIRGLDAAIIICFRLDAGPGTGFCAGAAFARATPLFPAELRTALIPRSFGNGWYDSPPGPSAPPFKSGSPLPPSRPYGEVANIPRRLFTCKTSGVGAGDGLRFNAISAPAGLVVADVAALSGVGAIGSGAAGSVEWELKVGTGNFGSAFTGVTS